MLIMINIYEVIDLFIIILLNLIQNRAGLIVLVTNNTFDDKRR